MPFSVVEFLSNPNWEDEFKTLTKENLLHFVLHFNLQANGQMKKEEIRRIVARKLVEEEIIDCYNTNTPQDNILLQIELEKLKIEVERLKLQNRYSTSNPVFDIAKNIKLVLNSQKIRRQVFFPVQKNSWKFKLAALFLPTLIQSVLTDKAAEVYSSLIIKNSADYTKIKTAILNAYELVPEAYRQAF